MLRLNAICRTPLLLFSLTIVLSYFLPVAIEAQEVFINELHYDNTGTDTGEFIEIAGPAGTDLTGWSIVLYNGNNGSVYNSIMLDQALQDQGNGSGFLKITYPTNGIQNGSPDGLALIDDTGTVIQFLSYEGSFAAVGGPADGFISEDIGVSESSSTPVGYSLQLSGTGIEYEDFSWSDPRPETLETVNTDQMFSDVDNPPGVGGTSPDDGEENVALDTNITITFSEDVTVTEPWFVIDCTSGVYTAKVSGSLRSYILNPNDDFAFGDTCDVKVFAEGVADLDEPLQNMTGDYVFSFDTLAEPIEVKIHEIQGSGSKVAITDPVIVEAIVVGDFQNGDQLDGFFIQEEDTDADDDKNTSEGIFVYCPECPTDVAVGDLVEVIGRPEDFFGMTQIDTTESGGKVSYINGKHRLPRAVRINLAANSGDTEAEETFEYAEGMLVTFKHKLFVSEYFNLARYGELVLTVNERPRQFTDANEPDKTGYKKFLKVLNSKRIKLDDDNNDQNAALSDDPADDKPYFWPRRGLNNWNFFRGGCYIKKLTGVLHWSYAGQGGTDAWRVRPVEEAFNYKFRKKNKRRLHPKPVCGSLKVASFNVLNYFTTLDEPGAMCGPNNSGCRGAHSEAELDRQRKKIANAICKINADIVGLIEIENNATEAIEDLLNGRGGVNSRCCGPYAYINTGVIGTDAIKVALIYKPAKVKPKGAFAILDSSVDGRFIDDKNRPALAQTFEEKKRHGVLTIAVNHFKSKGSDCNDLGDLDEGDGQGNCNLTRTNAAEALVDWLAGDPTCSNDPDFLVIGDLNAYRNEDPIDAIEEGADDLPGTTDDYIDLQDELVGKSAYSYVFDGQLGYLDHALANASLFDQVKRVTQWHINADEVPLFDYNDGIEDEGEAFFERKSTARSIYRRNAYRASDHDPIIIGLKLKRR
jgi:predicted extracellular nuclease